ncbi:MAG: C10 family peptidase [Bacteroidaceae bacterium]|nr:C10 family peptidase [Bacteroidaceae bacterium]
MKKLIVCALTLMVSFAAWAGDRSDEEMQAIALSQMVAPSAKGMFPTTFHVNRLKQYDQMSVYGNEDGFVFVSHDDRIKPVLGYSAATFDAGNLPEGLRWWIQKMDQCLADWRNTPDDVVAARQEAVLRLVEGYSAVPNFVKSEWDQGDPYNYYVPVKVGSEKAFTGCVATAMAQILYYFKYPAQGKGEGCYYVGNSDTPKRVDVNGVYNYAKMKAIYAGKPTDEQREAIGTLMRDCGYAAQMSYNVDGLGSSGAHIFHAAAGMAENFSYDELAIRYYTRDYFTEAEWLKLVYDELSLKRPILYGGVQLPSSGHAFVLSGFNDDGLVFVNWGWSGSGNDYYDISLLNSPSGTFSAEQDMAFRFKTHPEADSEDYFESMWGFYKAGDDDGDAGWSASISSTALKLTYDSYYNAHFLSFRGWVGAVFENVTTHEIKASIFANNIDVSPLGAYTGSVKSLKFTQLTSLSPGTYRLYIGSQHEDEAKPSPVRSQNQVGAVYYELTKTDDTHYTLSEAKNFADDIVDPVTKFQLVYMLDGEVYKTYSLKEGEAITPEPAPEKEDYVFSGWSEIPATMPAHDVVVSGSLVHTYAHVTLSPAGYATFYAGDEAFTLPSDVTASVVSGVSGGKLTYESLGQTIPVATAVILKGTSNAAVTLTRAESATAYPGTNLLYGSDEATTTTASGANLYYKLAYGASGTYQADVFGWYWGAADGAAFKIEGGKAWLALPVTAAKERRFFRLDEDATGIDEVETPGEDAAVYYDLQGRRVTTPAHGLFIRNGRKVFVK